MSLRYQKHYTRDEARALLPQIKVWLKRLVELRGKAEQHERRLEHLRTEGADLGGATVNACARTHAQLQAVLLEFYQREIEIKDLERGLIDFPAIIAGREVFLCWEKGEKDIEFWHDLDAGYAGREPL